MLNWWLSGCKQECKNITHSAYEHKEGPNLTILSIFQYSIVTCRTVPGRATSTFQGVRPGQQDYVEFTGQIFLYFSIL